MSDVAAWRDLFVATDPSGLATLRRSAQWAVDSLEQPYQGPRSSRTPTQLREGVRSIQICPDEGVALDVVLDELGTEVWAHGVRPLDVACVAHLHPPSVVPAVVSELTIASANQSMDSWDQSPAATEVELHLMDFLGQRVGLPPESSGVMTSGGTASNLLGLTLARSWAAAKIGVDVLKEGLPEEARQWRIIASDQAHFSIQRAAAQMGLGRDAVVTVATDERGAMSLDSLDATLAELSARGLRVIAVCATAGTTDLGAIDPLERMAERAQRTGAWFHVDAAVAGAFVMSDALRPRVRGLELADSITVDFHKLWWQPFNASALLARDVARFDLLRVRSNYLDRGDELEGMVNLVGRSLDTSRRFDAAKVVVSLRTIGQRRFAAMLEHLVALNEYAASVIARSGVLELVAPPSTVSCVFDAPRYGGEDLRRLQQGLLAEGTMVLGRTEIDARPALKLTFMNPLATRDDVDAIVALITHRLQNR
ncbi:MAG: aminotransferase class V-fold PLP-dependent enzyme [Acidobacteriota bacterium]|nr:aminotransferase class V-fold PLP-dependent enzyme [Acidobacteriota bacterium]